MNEEIRVLHTFKQMNRGGAESLIMNVMRNLSNERIKFFFLVMSPSPGHFDNEIRELGGEIIYIKPLSENKRFSKDLAEVLGRIKPDVIHSHLFTFSGYILRIARKCNVPIRIAHSHTIDEGEKKKLLRKIYIRLMKKLIGKNGTHLLGCSVDACDTLFGENSTADSRVRVLKNAIDLGSFKENHQKTDNLRLKFNLAPKSIIVGHVGNFRYPKNHEKVIKVFIEFQNKKKDAHLFLVGDGILKKEMEELAINKGMHNKIHFLGMREDIPQLMQQFDVFLFPSRYEGLGLVLIEAQAAGISSITSNRVPKEVDLGIDRVKFVPIEKSNSYWVKEMSSVLDLPKVPWVKREESLKENGYDIKIVVQELEEIYLEYLESKNEY